MAKKRFTDAEKYGDPWFTDLNAKMKSVYLYILDTCDCAGVWKSNFKMIKTHWEISVTHEDMLCLAPKVERISSENYLVLNFIRFQYGDNLNLNSNITKGILKSIEYNNIQSKGLIRVDQGLGKGSPRGKDKDKSMDMDKDMDKERTNTNSAPIAERKIEGCKDFSASYEMVRILFNELVSGKGSVKPEHGFFMSPKIQDKFLEILGHEYFTKIENWRTYFETISTSDFLLGIGDKPNSFKVSFLWVLDINNAQPIMSGQYDNSGTKGELEYQRSIDELSKKYQE